MAKRVGKTVPSGQPEARPFVGRRHELQLLERLRQKSTSSLVVVKGRRRIGKSRLISEFAKSFPVTYSFSGLPPRPGTSPQAQRDEFAEQLCAVVGSAPENRSDWTPLLWHLAASMPETGPVLVVLDEISWLGGLDPDFLGKLKTVWDLQLCKNPQAIVVLSGSLSLWIDENIINSEGFYGRVSLNIELRELGLAHCQRFWGGQAPHVSRTEMLRVLAVTGGVPRYLEELVAEQSAEENIRHMCFLPSGLLYSEFDIIFKALFGSRNDTYEIIVRRLASGRAPPQAIYEALSVQKSGVAHRYLENLRRAGFISRDRTWSLRTAKASPLSHYRLSDNYLRFFLKYIEPNRDQIDRRAYAGPSAWPTIIGLQFENLLLNNRRALLSRLGIDPRDVQNDNPFFQRPTRRVPGCQIDYLIQTTHGTLYACEAKFVRRELGEGIITEVRERLARLKAPRGFSVRPVLVHVNGVAPAVEESGFFARIVDFAELFDEDENASDSTRL